MLLTALATRTFLLAPWLEMCSDLMMGLVPHTSNFMCLLLALSPVDSITSLIYADPVCAGPCLVVDLVVRKVMEISLSLLCLFAFPYMKVTLHDQSLFLL